MDEDCDFDVRWNTWPLQSVPEVKRLLFNILASPRLIFSQDVLVCHFYNLPISHICMIARLGLDTFNHLVWILTQNSLFLLPWKPQHPVKYQLAVFLIQYMVNGVQILLMSLQNFQLVMAVSSITVEESVEPYESFAVSI